MDLNTHQLHAKHFVRYYTRLIADYGDYGAWQRGLEYAREYEAIMEQESFDLERIQRLADALENFKSEGSAALDMYLHVKHGLLRLANTRT